MKAFRDFGTTAGLDARSTCAFTLVELLVVMGIIGLLVSMLLPAFGRMKQTGKIQRARLEMSELIEAITEYEAANSKYPVSQQAVRSASMVGEDMTYGGIIQETRMWVAGPAYLTNNCEIVAVLLDLEHYGDGTPTINEGHVKNPGHTRFLNPHMNSGTNAAPGVSRDGLYRDPWGSPYMITVDLNGDGRARDAFYRTRAVSQDPRAQTNGLKGLVRNIDAWGNTSFEATVPVIVWSPGPNRRIDFDQRADEGVNRDNVLSWSR